ncbi:IclR family transcriptional regulator [Mycobacteroides abscessus subsp. bolletii]|uniref:IclR family transcriptional regulator n=1 Tax=Mycobacteroides abscessus TaxID=36809 RepID=UPI0009A75482|nr:IclR family transcriptional regulator [Mycobacteroides abscessus]SKG69749.1 IclR family transcriptional regulator [Mycobacteroides abscessus subsp. bolletii]SKH12468.1 IclR family transcriptional regulator [Mycobacteroides abscessus subsp. bolletii]
MARPLKERPAYAIASVDHALRAAAMLQLEGEFTVSQVANRLGVARSTAHRLLAMLVYRDFAVQSDERTYRAGPVLELAAHSQSLTSRLRTCALPHLHRVVDLLGESANLIIRTGATARFILSIESPQTLRVGTREGMVFPAHMVTGGLVLLAELTQQQLEVVYGPKSPGERAALRPDLDALRRDLERIRKSGFALNRGISERGVVAVGRTVRGAAGTAVAGISVSMPSVRYQPQHLERIVAALGVAATAIEADLRNTD